MAGCGAYLEKTNPKKNKTYRAVKIHTLFFSTWLNIFLNKMVEPIKNSQNKIGIFFIAGPKLLAHSVKYGCLFSATVWLHLPVIGLNIIWLIAFTFSIINPAPKKRELRIIKRITAIINEVI